LGLTLERRYLIPLTVIFLLISVTALALHAKERRGYWPLSLGLLAAVLITAGKFALNSSLVMWLGMILLIAASLWNAWPRKCCPVCSDDTAD
jgi:hypothetical protein